MSNVRGLYPPLYKPVPAGGGGGSSQASTMPEPSESNVNKILQYTGEDTENFKCGYFYKCIATTVGDVTTYSWIYIDVDADDGQRIQLTQMPTPDVEQAGKIVQYIGTTDLNYTNGYFYKCVSDGQDPATYSWIPSPTQEASTGGYTISTTEVDTGIVFNGKHVYCKEYPQANLVNSTIGTNGQTFNALANNDLTIDTLLHSKYLVKIGNIEYTINDLITYTYNYGEMIIHCNYVTDVNLGSASEKHLIVYYTKR
jgi:hypothetical protein